VTIDEASAGDFLLGLGAVGGLLALKKGWDTFGKGTKLQAKLHALNPFQTKADKAAVAKDAEDKRKNTVDNAKTILDDPNASAKDKKEAEKDLEKHQTDDEKETRDKEDKEKGEKERIAKGDLTPAEIAQKKIDKAAKASGEKDTLAKADELDVKNVGDAQAFFKKHDRAPAGYQEYPDDSGTVVDTKTAEKEKEIARKEREKKAAQAAADKKRGGEEGEAGKENERRKEDEKRKKRDDAAAAAAANKETTQKNSYKPKGNMTITESNELQAIMALDDAGISAEINRKGEVAVKKKDLKKAQKALKKSFKKGGEPKLVGEEVVVLQPDELVDLSTYIEMKMSNMAKKKKAMWAKSSKGKASLKKSKIRSKKVASGSIKIDKAKGRAMSKARARGGIRNEFELGEGLLSEALGKLDKSVIDAFYYKKEKAGKVVSTDGDSLNKIGMGGQTIAQWLDPSGKIAISAVTDVKSTESILKYMKKSIPKGNFDKKSYKKFFGEELQRTAYELVSEARKKSIANKPQWEQE
jgi:hypothetical protein